MLLPLRSVPQLTHVDPAIFSLRYFGTCMECTFCHDWCCQFGCDVDLAERDRLLAVAAELSKFVRAPAGWFEAEERVDPEFPSGRFVRARTQGGACVFRSRDGRGCGIHAYALAKGHDFRRLKPLVCRLFPICWDQGVLKPSREVQAELVCAGKGPTLYEETREELSHAFGDALVEELDALFRHRG